MGYVTLACLSGLVGVASLLAARRMYPQSRVDAWLAASALALLSVVVPIHTLGWLGQLDAPRLGLGSGLLASFVGGLALRGAEPSSAAFARRAFRELLTFPHQALVIAWRASPLVGVALVAVLGMCSFTAVYAYLAPSCSWDGVWYHESIVGFAIQERGFAWVDVPGGLEYVNGYPKSSELLSLWCVIFSGRSLIEVVESGMALILLLGMYGLARRIMTSRVHALGLACALVLTPAVALQLRSTLTDVCFAAVFVLATHFVTRPGARLTDLALGLVLTGLMASMKVTGVVVAPVLAAVVYARAFGGRRRLGARRVVSALLLAGLVAVGLSVPGYARNWQRTGNPVWPIAHEVPELGLHFDGPQQFHNERPQAWDELFSPPRTPQLRDTRDNGYGNVLPFVWPWLLLAALVELARDAAQRRLGSAHGLLLVSCAAAVPSLALSPAGWWCARLHLHVLVAALLAGGWVLGDVRRRHIADGVLGALLIGSLITLSWSLPAWDITWERARLFATLPAHERAVFPMNQTSPAPDVARAREREQTAGSVLAYDGAYLFPSALWNDAFSNRVRYLNPTRGGLLAPQLDDVSATWMVVRTGSPWDRELSARPTWDLVGDVDPRHRAYRRRDDVLP
ncbi:MAG: hypothetical protein KC668_07705 [Myxococcales bacterium]|nr:hypothetical protein [Myxococcales bacterium]